MSNDTAQEVIDELLPIFAATEAALNDWTGDGNMQFSVLLGMVAMRLNWNEKQVRKNDPFIREYVRKNIDWHVTRGAGGGIMRASDKNKKEAVKNAKDAAKKQIEALLKVKIDNAQAKLESNSEEDTSDDIEE